MGKYETATQRRARQAAEVDEAKQRFQAEKYCRMMHALARAQDLGFEVKLTINTAWGTDALIVEITDRHCQLYCDSYYYMDELVEWKMTQLEQNLADLQNKREEERKRARMREELLARLTPEERELLGV